MKVAKMLLLDSAGSKGFSHFNASVNHQGIMFKLHTDSTGPEIWHF